MKIEITLQGTRALIMHNERLANPIDKHTRQLKALTSKRKKTDEDLVDIMKVEARGGAYETSDGLLGLPTRNVWRCIYDSAKAYKQGENIKRALLADDEVMPLFVAGHSVDVDEYLADPAHIDYRSVVVQRSRTMRARPIVHDWSSSHVFELREDVIDARELIPILERAGRLVGLCEWRPTYGTFTCTTS